MLEKDKLDRIREEHEAFEHWRQFSRHVVAELLEACSICGTVRERDRLTRCRWCEDVYVCKDGLCRQQHQADIHPAVAFWTW